MASKTYTVVYRKSGTPETGLSPTFGLFVNVADAVALTEPTVTELGSGAYKFTVDWDAAAYDGVDQIAIQVDAGAGSGLSDDDRYVFGLIERQDLAETYTLLSAMVLGNWTIESNQLKIFTPEDTVSPLKTFDLTDINGDPTSLSATTRTAV